MEGRNNLKFTQDDKKLLIKYIETIKSKKVLINIFKIINNDTKKYSKNNNGVFINLKNVSNKALHLINNLIIDYQHLINSEKESESNLSETLSFHKDEFKEFEDSSAKLSNHEKNILRKNRIEKNNKKKSNIIYGSFLLSSENDTEDK
jgi:hypothetical protein